jgi:PAS domain S-box-containing protein
MTNPLRVLIVEDSEGDALLLIRELGRGGFDPVSERVDTREAMQKALRDRKWDVVISDYVMPRFSGLDALGVLRESGNDLPFIIVSGNIGEDIAVSAMKAGAHDYLIKGNLKRLAPAVERELRDAEVRRACRQAEEGRLLLAAAIESTVDAVVITNARGFIQYINAAFEQTTGYAKSEAIGGTLHILDSGKHDEDFFRGLRETLNREGVWSGRLFNKKKDGTLYLEDATCSAVKDLAGNSINYVSVKRDVTEKVRLESIAEAVNMMDNIGYIFSGVRHEIGNPVNTINMTLSLLKEKLGTIDQPTVEKYLDRALEGISRIDYLLRSLKNFNMYEKPARKNLPIEGFMNNVLALVGEDFKAKGIGLVISRDPNAEVCYADPRALQQVLINLLTNAADALHGRRDPNVAISLFRSDGTVRFRVEDNGCGISEEKQKDLFKPFLTSKVKGTGLGLVIVKKMLAQMNGTIEISSRKDEGTAVDIYLPVSEDGLSVT